MRINDLLHAINEDASNNINVQKAWFNSKTNQLIPVPDDLHHGTMLWEEPELFNFESVYGISPEEYVDQYAIFDHRVPLYDEQLINSFIKAGWVRLGYDYDSRVPAFYGYANTLRDLAKGLRAFYKTVKLVPDTRDVLVFDVLDNKLGPKRTIIDDQFHHFMKTGAISRDRIIESENDSLEDIMTDAEHEGIKLYISKPNNNVVELNKIVIPKESRGNNLGTKFLTRLIKWADENNTQITLNADTSFGGSSVNRLMNFYQRFGFVKNQGRSKDFSTKNNMIRNPKSKINESKDELDNFLTSNSRNSWLHLDGFDIYVRKAIHYIDNKQVKCFDLATVNSETPGSGKFRGFLKALEQKIKAVGVYECIYVESVLNDGLVRLLPELGYKEVPGSDPICFYKELL